MAKVLKRGLGGGYGKLTLACTLAAVAAFGAGTDLQVASDLSITLTTGTAAAASNSSASNPNAGGPDGYNLRCSDGVAISLVRASTTGMNRFLSTVVCDSGVVTLDLSQMDGAPFLMMGNFHLGSSATLHIKGTNTVHFGSDQAWPSYYPTFNIPYKVEFDEGVDGKIVFRDLCCLYKLPPELDYSIAAGANVAVHDNALGVAGDYTLTDFDITLFDSTETGDARSFPVDSTITVPSGRTLNVFPCAINSSLRWDRKGGIISNSVALAGGTLAFRVNQNFFRLAGGIAGRGTIKGDWTTSNWTADKEINVNGPVALTNAVVNLQGRNSSSAYGMRLNLSKVRPGTSFSSITMHKTSAATETCRLGLGSESGADYTGAPVTVAALTGGNLSTGVLEAYVPLSIAAANGGLTLRNNDSATFAAIDANAGILALDGSSLVLPADWFAYIATGGLYRLCNVPDGGTLDLSEADPVTGMDVDVSGRLSIVGANPMCRITAAEGSEVDMYQSSGVRMQVIAAGGRINLHRAFQDWRTIPTLWLDASAANTVSNLHIKEGTILNTSSSVTLSAQAVFYTNSFPLVNQWFDCREDMRSYKAWSDRYDKPLVLSGVSYNALFAHTHPYRVTGGLNGKDYISFGRAATSPSVEVEKTDGTLATSANGNMNRFFFYPQNGTAGGARYYPKPMFAFLVFGSQMGGGAALLGSSVLARTSSADAAAAIAPNADIDVWVDGVSVSPKAENALNGGWQVVTLGLKGDITLYGLGFAGNDSSGNGGQNYAEVILVDKELTDMQRQTIEIALAEKWGLSGQYSYPQWALEAATAVYGASGTVRLETDAKLSGAFSGVIELNGKALTIDGAALPPDESAVDTSGMVGWYDPDAAGMVSTQTVASKNPSERMKDLWNRLNDGFKTGDYALWGQGLRAPYLNSEVRGIGPARKWMDFANLTTPGNITDGNVLRFSKINDVQTGGTDGGTYQQPMRTIMMVQDSVRGGGQPFADGANVNSPRLYKQRIAGNSNAIPGNPIYPDGTDAVLTGGKTYLDGNEVDGTASSFSGRPEVLTVVPADEFNVVAIGQLGNSEKRSVANGNTTAEIIGEILMWDHALDDGARAAAEAYLSWKWLGTTAPGYSALTNATVTGTGSVVAADVSLLPKFAAGCTAEVTVPANALTFGYAGGAFPDALRLGQCALSLSASCTVTISAEGELAPGDYTLISCGSGLDDTAFALARTKVGGAVLSLVREDSSLVLHAVAAGTVIIFR